MKNVEITCNSQSIDIFDFVKLRSHTNESPSRLHKGLDQDASGPQVEHCTRWSVISQLLFLRWTSHPTQRLPQPFIDVIHPVNTTHPPYTRDQLLLTQIKRTPRIGAYTDGASETVLERMWVRLAQKRRDASPLSGSFAV
jgi:hypothetical protein